MIRIVGRKILMQKRESGAFRILLIDSRGNELKLSQQDRFIFRARYSMEAVSSIRKVSTPIEFSENGISKVYHIIEFSPADTQELLVGDYQYEVLLDRDNQRTIVLPTSLLTIENSLDSEFPEDDISISETPSENDEDFLIIFGDDDTSEDDDIILFEEDDSTSYYYSIITSTPLVCNFNAVTHRRSTDTSNDDLIII